MFEEFSSYQTFHVLPILSAELERFKLSSTDLPVKLQTYIHTQIPEIRDIEPCSINWLKVKWYAQGFVQTSQTTYTS